MAQPATVIALPVPIPVDRDCCTAPAGDYSALLVHAAQLHADLGEAQAALAAAHTHRWHLEIALHTNRDIGAAVGVLMAKYALTQTGAFEILRTASQTWNQKLHGVALDVLQVGDLCKPEAEPAPQAAPSASVLTNGA